MNKKIVLLLSMALAMSAVTISAKTVVDLTDEAADEAKEGKKARFNFPAGDTTFSFGGDLREEYRLALNPVFLNDALPDDFNFFRNTLELKSNFAWGEKKYGHKAIEMLATLRHKGNWGDTANSARSSSTSLKFADKAQFGDHTHGNNYPLVWVKELWANISLNAALDNNSDLVQSVKVGMFPFALGRGISLGYAYGLNKSFLGVYSAVTDHCAPGILLTGELVKDTLSYDVYAATFESNSGSTRQVLSPTKSNQIGKRAKPFSGSFNDDTAIAGQLHYKTHLGSLSAEVAPYILYNAARNKQVEVPADSDSYLSTAGLNIECEAGDLEFGGEFAFNMGYQDVHSIDRDTIKIGYRDYSAGSAGNSYLYHSKVTTDHSLGGALTAAEVNAAHDAAIVANNTAPVNGGTFTYTVPAGGLGGYAYNDVIVFTNASDRVRPAYQNKYAGYMMVLDGAYTFRKIGLKLAAAAGMASGDANPNDTEVSTTYRGFVSLNEIYTGNQVQSLMIMDQRNNKRPLSLQAGSKNAPAEDNSFSDLIFAGASATIKPNGLKKLTINPNVMGFWKDHQSAAWDSTTGAASTKAVADPFLGTELNTKFSYEIFEDTKLFGAAACFIPGQFYKDIKGATLKDDIVTKLEVADKTGVDATAYRIGTNTSYYFNLGINFVF